MYVTNRKTKENVEVEVLPVEEIDYEIIRESKRFLFNWEMNSCITYKLCLSDSKEILGLISFKIVSQEFRLQIVLLEVSIENVGKQKIYDRVAGILIAFACRISFEEGCYGFVSLVPKTVLREHYMEKYGFIPMANHLATDGRNAHKLISNYLLM